MEASDEAAVDGVLKNWEGAITGWEYDEDAEFLIIEAAAYLKRRQPKESPAATSIPRPSLPGSTAAVRDLLARW